MIDKEQLKSIADLQRLSLKNAEKAYVQELMLYLIYRAAGKNLVFKGGTCLYKVFKLDRFSEDLDFDAAQGFDADKMIKKILYDLKLLDINSSIKYLDEFEKGVNIGINFNGPLYDGTKGGLCFLLLNISTRRKPILAPKSEKIKTIYREFPDFDVYVMDPIEILAEKVAAIHERNKPRDVYDAWFLLKRLSVQLDKSLVRKKLKKEFNQKLFMEKITEKRLFWNAELGKFVIGQLPEFSKIMKEIETCISTSH